MVKKSPPKSTQEEPTKIKPGKRSADPKRKIKEEISGVNSVADYLGSVNKRKIIKTWDKPGVSQMRWWLEEDNKLYASIENVVSTIESSQSARRLNNNKFTRMYGNYEALGFANNSRGMTQESSNRVTLNVIQSVIDAVAAKIAKDKPKVSFVTTGAEDYFLRLRATKLTKYVS